MSGARRLTLRQWFGAFHLAANLNATPPLITFQRLYAIDQPQAYRLSRRIRLQMALQECARQIGGDRVFVSEVVFRRLRRKPLAGPKRKRVLCISTADLVAYEIPVTSRPQDIFRALALRIAPGTTIDCAGEVLRDKLGGYRQRAFPIADEACGRTAALRRNETAIILTKRVLRRVYTQIATTNLGEYLNEQSFRINAPRDQALFHSIIARFPSLPGLPKGTPR